MISKFQSQKVYIFSALLLCTLTYLLNYCASIYQCALVFSIIAAVLNVITHVKNKELALKTLAIAVTVSFLLLWRMPYYIDGKLINGLVVASFMSLMISMYWSTIYFKKLCEQVTIGKANFLSLGLAAIIDGMIMGVFFVINNNFSYARILDIFIKEVSYKMLYGVVTSMAIAQAFTLYSTHKQKKKSL